MNEASSKLGEAKLVAWDIVVKDALAKDAAMRTAKEAGDSLGPKCFLPRLADAMGGYWPEGVSVIHGGPGTGKTALAWQMALCADCPVLYVTCEVTPRELLRRTVAYRGDQYENPDGRSARVTYKATKTGEIKERDAQILYESAAQQANHITLLDATTDPAPAERVLEFGQSIKGSNPHLLIVIDSLHTWAEAIAGGTEYEALGQAVASLREIANRIGATVLALCESNRAASKEGSGKQADLHGGAGSRKLEYGAEVVIRLSAEGDSLTDVVGHRQGVNAKISKNRHGPAGVEVAMLFRGNWQAFSPVD